MIPFMLAGAFISSRKPNTLPPSFIGRTALIVNLESIPSINGQSKLQTLSNQFSNIFSQGATLAILSSGKIPSDQTQFANDMSGFTDIAHRNNVNIAAMARFFNNPSEDESTNSLQRLGLDGVVNESNNPVHWSLSWFESNKQSGRFDINDKWLSHLIGSLKSAPENIAEFKNFLSASKPNEIVTSSPFEGPSLYKECQANESIAKQALACFFFQPAFPALCYGDGMGTVSDSRSSLFVNFPPPSSQIVPKLSALTAQLISLRNKRQSLTQGDFSILQTDSNDGTLVAVRNYRFESTLLFINIDTRPHQVMVNFPMLNANSLKDLVGGAFFKSTSLNIQVTLSANGYALLGTG